MQAKGVSHKWHNADKQDEEKQYRLKSPEDAEPAMRVDFECSRLMLSLKWDGLPRKF